MVIIMEELICLILVSKFFIGLEIECTALDGDQSENNGDHSEKMNRKIVHRGTRTPDVELGGKSHQLNALTQSPRQLGYVE